MKQQLLLVILLTLYFVSTFFAHSAKAQRNDTALERSVVSITNHRVRGLPIQTGAGFFITPSGHILTTAHLFIEKDEITDGAIRKLKITIQQRNQQGEQQARILSMNRFLDLALLKIKKEGDIAHLPLETSAIVKGGDALKIVGHPLKLDKWYVSHANVDSINRTERIVMPKGTLSKGFSGGPAVNIDGRVVGIASHIDENRSYLIPVSDIQIFLTGITYAIPNRRQMEYMGTLLQSNHRLCSDLILQSTVREFIKLTKHGSIGPVSKKYQVTMFSQFDKFADC